MAVTESDPDPKMDKLLGFDFWRQRLNGARLVVAPMVDQSELPWRLLCRRYGAELCYSPMYHASVFTREPGYRKDALATCPEDRPLIIQFCANNPDTLVEAAKLAQSHCDAIDLNLGCPQMIAKRGNYGAFLQQKWDLVHDLVKRCADELDVPITCKIRVFEDVEKTVEYAQMLEKAGCQLLTVHGRTREQKGVNTGLASWKHIKAVKDKLKIPVFANGNILELEDAERCMKETCVDGVMSAEGNLHNPAIFSGKHPVSWEVALEYLELARKYPATKSAIRGHSFRMLHHPLSKHKHLRDVLGNARTIDEIITVVNDLKDICQEDIAAYEKDKSSLGESELSYPYWLCQPYIRPSPDEAAARLQELKRRREENSNNEGLSRKQLKKMNKRPRVGKRHFPPCSCGNPKGLKCEFNFCKKCCRDRASKSPKNCQTHRIWIEFKNQFGRFSKKDGKVVADCADSAAADTTTESEHCDTSLIERDIKDVVGEGQCTSENRLDKATEEIPVDEPHSSNDQSNVQHEQIQTD